MSDLAVDASRTPSFFDDPFEAMNRFATSGDLLQSADAFGADVRVDSFVDRVFPLATVSRHNYDLRQGYAEAMALPLETGFAAIQEGTDAMRQWVRFQLGVVEGVPLPFEVKLFQDGGFARGLVGQWNKLIDDTMQQMSPEARRRYERVLNEEMDRALQLALLHDEAIGEYAPIAVRDFSATGLGQTRQRVLEASTRAEALALQRQDAKAQQKILNIERKAAAEMREFGFDGANALRFAGERLDRQNGYVEDGLERPAVEFRIDEQSIAQYQNAKFEAAVEYSMQFPEIARGGIVAIAMGEDYARMWLATQLGFEDGKEPEAMKDDEPAPYTRALQAKWGKLTGETLMAMPEFLREKYAPLANETLARGVNVTLHLDARAGKYQPQIFRDFTSAGLGEDEFNYFLNEDGSLGREMVQKDDSNCIEDIILPIVNVVLYFVPVVGPALGAAMTVALAVKSGVETGNWLGAVAGAALAVAGAGAGAKLFGAASQTIGTVVTTARTVINVGGGAYTLARGIDSGDPLTALGGGLSVVGGLAGLSADGEELNLADGADTSITTQDAVQYAVRFGQAGLGVYQGVEYDNPMAIAGGLTSALTVGADVFDLGDSSPLAYSALGLLDTSADLASSAMYGDSLGMSAAATRGLAYWYGIQSLDTGASDVERRQDYARARELSNDSNFTYQLRSDVRNPLLHFLSYEISGPPGR